jgi:hypothetical protein
VKRRAAVLLTVLLCAAFFAPAARADMGPKPSLGIVCRNAPPGEAYIDLLVETQPKNNQIDPTGYNQTMLAAMRAHETDGWQLARITGTAIPIFGDIRCEVKDGEATVKFSYVGIPDRFKVIAATEDGRVTVSNVVERHAFASVVYFDYATGRAMEKSPVFQLAAQFLLLLGLTLLIEGVILPLFGFDLRRNWKPFLAVNAGTQLTLNLIVAIVNLRGGMLNAFLVYLLFELVILTAEAILYAKFLKQHSRMRRVTYAIVANTASFAAGVILMLRFKF